jgi:hypothetical protein
MLFLVRCLEGFFAENGVIARTLEGEKVGAWFDDTRGRVTNPTLLGVVRLLLFILVFIVILPVNAGEDQDRSIRKLQEIGAVLLYEETSPGKPLFEVDLNGCRKLNTKIIRMLSRFPTITCVNFDHCNLNGSDLEQLLALESLEGIFLAGTVIRDAHLIHLRQFTHLTELGLSDTLITAKGLRQLKWLKRIETLDLTRCLVNDSGLEHIQNLHKLQILLLRGTYVTDKSIPYLKKLENLQYLDLRETLVSKKGVAQLRHDFPPGTRVFWNGKGPSGKRAPGRIMDKKTGKKKGKEIKEK